MFVLQFGLFQTIFFGVGGWERIAKKPFHRSWMAPPMYLESEYHLDPPSLRARLVDGENQSFAKDGPYIPIDRQVYTFHSQRGEKVVINEVYQLSPLSPMIVKECGSWDRQAGLKLTSASILQ